MINQVPCPKCANKSGFINERDKATKIIQWVNKELVKWVKSDDGDIQTIKGRKEKMKLLIDKGIKKFQYKND